MISTEQQQLEDISKEYIDPDAGRKIDQLLLSMIVQQIMPWVKGPEVLEMGFGDGQWTELIISKFGHSNIVDCSKTLLKLVKNKYQEKAILHESLFEEFQPSRKYDSIVCSYVLEHVVNPIEILRKASGWLKENGSLVVIVPHADSFHRRLAVLMNLQDKTSDLGPTDIKMGHRRVYSIAQMENDLKAAKLKVINHRGLFLKFLPQNLMTSLSRGFLEAMMLLSREVPMEYSMAIAFNCTV